MASPIIDPDTLLAKADAHRRDKDWMGAADAYRQFTILRPNDWTIIVQEGHCLKEGGKVAEALARYREAEALAPDDADLQVQIGHAQKVLGRWHDAARAYHRALAMNPSSAAARVEAAATAEWLTGPEIDAADRAALSRERDKDPRFAPFLPVPQPVDAAIATVFDVTDLLQYFNDRRTPTGIQRVQSGIITRALTAPAAGMAISLAYFEPRQRVWKAVDRHAFTRLCALSAAGADTQDPEWTGLRDAVRRLLNATGAMRFPRDALLVNLGNSWSLTDYFRALRQAQRDHGVRYVPFVHDCVPLIVPEHCLTGLVHSYVRWFSALGLHAHGLLCNSENTRDDLRKHMEALRPGLTPPTHVVRLDADPRGLLPPQGNAAPMEALRALRHDESFALFVATLESRKNHLLVFNAWLKLLREHGAEAIPRLVCVGKPGWHADAALKLLETSPELQRHVLLLPQVSDQELDALYDRCAFTVYNSHYEGWGLPITEALAHGKVTITPRHSALTEAGGDVATYFTPQSLPELTATLEKVILDPAYRAAQEALIRAKGQPRSWDAVKDEALDAIRALAAQPVRPVAEAATVALGQHYKLRRMESPTPALAPAMAELVREGPGWYPLEKWGVSTMAGLATLRLPLPAGTDAPLRLYLEMRAPADMEVELRFHSEGSQAQPFLVSLPAGEPRICLFDLPALPGTSLSIELDSGDGPYALQYGEARRLGVGLLGFMLCRLDDHAARLGMLEEHSLNPVSPALT